LKLSDRCLKDRLHLRVESTLKEKSSWQQKKSVLASLEQMCATAGGRDAESTIWWDYKPAEPAKFNRVRDLVADGYVGKVLSCTMIITTPAWGTEFTLDWAYMADRSSGNTLMTSPGGHSIDALCYCLGEFKELSSVVAN
jgi:hypothetical protein